MIARALQDRGLRVFFDRWYLVPGRPWPEELERALAACHAIAVVLGPQEMGQWQQREKNLALDHQARDPEICSDPYPAAGGGSGVGVSITEYLGRFA